MTTEFTSQSPVEPIQSAGIDFLTGLHNREAMMRTLDEHVENSPGEFGLLVLDPDDLKKHNDAEGHAAGDEYLKGLADVLRMTRHQPRDNYPSRPLDQLGIVPAAFRFGGDEFAVLLEGVSSQEQVDTVADRLQSALSDKGIRASIGGMLHKPSDSAETTLKTADKCMYQNKEARKKREAELRHEQEAAEYKQQLESLPRYLHLYHKVGALLVTRSGVKMPR